jgi:hypothetical protein
MIATPMSETVFDRDKRIRSAALTMSQTFYLTTLNQYIGKNPDAWPSQTTLANSMNATTRAVRNWQAELEGLGIIRVQVGKGRSSTNRYRLNLNSLTLKEERGSAFSEVKEERGSALRRNHVPLNEEPRSYRKNRNNQLKEQAFFLPPELDNEEFRSAWLQWIGFRREIKKKLTPSTVSKQLELLATWGSVKSIQAIQASITNGWQGLFDPSQRTGKAASASVNCGNAWQILKQAINSLDKSKPYKDLLRQQLKPEIFKAAETVGFKALFSIDQYNESKLSTAFSMALAGEKN